MKIEQIEFKGTKLNWNSCCLSAKPHFIFAEGSEYTICSIIQSQDDGKELPIEEVRANALLISKAPQMFRQLRKAMYELYTLDNEMANEIKEFLIECIDID